MKDLGLFFVCLVSLMSPEFSYGDVPVMENHYMLNPVDPNLIHPGLHDRETRKPAEAITWTSPTPTPTPKQAYPSVNDIKGPHFLPRNFTAALDKQNCEDETAKNRTASVRISWSAPQNKTFKVDSYVVHVRGVNGDQDYMVIINGSEESNEVTEDLKCGLLYVFNVQAQYKIERKSAAGKTDFAYVRTPKEIATLYTDRRSDIYAPRDLKMKVVYASCGEESWIRTASIILRWTPPENTSVPVHSYIANAINVDDGRTDNNIIINDPEAVKQEFEGFKCGTRYILTLQARYLVTYRSVFTGEPTQYTFESSPSTVKVSIGESDELTTVAYYTPEASSRAPTTPSSARTSFQTKVTAHPGLHDKETRKSAEAITWTSPTPTPTPKHTYPSVNDIKGPQFLPRNFTAALDKQNCEDMTAKNRTASVRISWAAPQNKTFKVNSYVVHVRGVNGDQDYMVIINGSEESNEVTENLECGQLYVFNVQAQYKIERNSAEGKTDFAYVRTPKEIATLYTDKRSDIYAPRDLEAKVVYASCGKESWIRTASIMLRWTPPENTSVPVHSYIANAINVDDGRTDKNIIINDPKAVKQEFEGFHCGTRYILTLRARYLVTNTSAIKGKLTQYTFVSSPSTVKFSIGEGDELTTVAYYTPEVSSRAPTTAHVTDRVSSPHPGRETSGHSHSQETTSHVGVSITTETSKSNSTDVSRAPHKDEISSKQAGMSTSKILMMVLIPLALIALGVAGFFAYKKAQRGRERGILSNTDDQH
ncbi:uncharacterized protein LOC8035031 isoform X1 [Ixodes scapularis]|uniref:uncharacterized protein LOC8035031 isoform X1 n=1 Tax=Ixodes scapularis TaxID=6945 RepID=UPI001C392EF1|nr:uncharacterized protein LOC8035031 isoform X1 [Ixodes scapularis]